MRALEIRRHSIRDSHSVNLNRAGVALARSVGAGLGPFAKVFSSPAARALQTAVAMGFAIDEERDELAIPDEQGVLIELDACRSFADVARLLRGGLRLPQYGRAQRVFALTLAAELGDGESALMLSHGSVIETLALACAPFADAAACGDGVSFCEGVRLSFEAGECVALDVLRVR